MSFITTNWSGRKIDHCKNYNEKNKRCIITVPVYKENPNVFEIASIKQCVKVLGDKFEILLFCPDELNLSKYEAECNNYSFSILRCDKRYFASQKSYSDLCETWQFYDLLSDYEYMIIYQLDAWIFEDKVEYFMNMGYDYIGGVHLVSFTGGRGENGNGGFCLRKPKIFKDVCRKTDFNKMPKGLLEDCCFTQRLKNNFNLAPVEISRQFSFQESPEKVYKMANNKLPMGCHAFKRFGWSFWKKFIQIDGYKEQIVNKTEIVRSMGYYISTSKNTNTIKQHKVIRKFR